MPAHGTCEEALANVAAFAAADKDARRNGTLKDKKSRHKHKHQDKDKDGGRKSGKHKAVKGKGKRRHKSPVTDSDSSDSDGGTLEQQLARSRAAVRATRELLSNFPEVRNDVRELLRRVDAGEALDLTGIAEPGLQQQLRELFLHLHLRCTSKGLFVRRPRASSSMSLLSGVLAETPAVLASGAATTPADAPICRRAEPRHHAGEAARVHPQRGASPERGLQRPAATHQVLTSALPDAGVIPAGGLPLSNGNFMTAPQLAEGSAAESGRTHTSTAIGPEPQPDSRPAEQAGEASPPSQAGSGDHQHQQDERADLEAHVAPKRAVAGPAMPPPELLAAAAAAAEEMVAEAEAADLLVGPVPPDVDAEMAAATGDERIAEVVRIMQALDSKEAAKDADPYVLLGLEASASAAEIKKRYWRLSLLTHPDKCPHPHAHVAFDAVSQAAKALQDASQRATIDQKRQHAKDMKDALEAAADEERARQWRIVQGKATAEDLAGPVRPPEPLQRGAWMTELPEERRPNAVPSQKSQTSFAAQGVQRRGDTSAWTDTPSQRLQRLQQSYEQASALPPSNSPGAQQLSEDAQRAVQGFNTAHRSETLLERHQGKMQKELKQRKRKAKEDGSNAAKPSWEGAHPWRPFDREKDMQTASRKMSSAEFVKKAGSLSGRFASG